MPLSVSKLIDELIPEDRVATRQAAHEIFGTLSLEEDDEVFVRALLLPERVVEFRVDWRDDKGNLHYNTGYRVQHSSLLGPYKGGLRFHPSVNRDVLSFLALEQTFKNALVGGLGGAKGGSDFDPRGKSEGEIRSFARSFIRQLAPYIGSQVDVPAGDIGVSGREIGFMLAEYQSLLNTAESGMLTGKPFILGGSNLRPEATGYGVVYFLAHMLGGTDSLKGKRVLVSGSGNVAQFTVEKLLEHGAVVLTMSDSSGVVVFADGATTEDLAEVKRIKNEAHGRLSDASFSSSSKYHKDKAVWDDLGLKADVAIPAATQNEVDGEAAKRLVEEVGISVICEAANMPSTAEAATVFHKAKIAYGPSKAANAGGVAVSGLEMAQNAAHARWSREKVDGKLRETMESIYTAAHDANAENLPAGANDAAWQRLREALVAQGRR
jgi:glutamate dehydrogenase (NADP+)